MVSMSAVDFWTLVSRCGLIVDRGERDSRALRADRLGLQRAAESCWNMSENQVQQQKWGPWRTKKASRVRESGSVAKLGPTSVLGCSRFKISTAERHRFPELAEPQVEARIQSQSHGAGGRPGADLLLERPKACGQFFPGFNKVAGPS